jgi:predicted nucleic acid-binding protein
MQHEKRHLVVDTNVLSRATNKKQTDAYEKLFKELEQKHKFTVSGFTRFELMRSSDKEHRTVIDNYLSQNMARIDLSSTLMDFTARVYFLYSKHSSTKNRTITDGDIVNAALAIIKDCPVLTHDGADYPAPFFKETFRKPITIKGSRGNEVLEMVYLLEPDMEHIKHCFGAHEV